MALRGTVNCPKCGRAMKKRIDWEYEVEEFSCSCSDKITVTRGLNDVQENSQDKAVSGRL